MSGRTRTAVQSLALAALLPLAACGPGRNEFAPACPSPKLVDGLADITRYAGTSRDLTDLVIQARVVKIDGACKAAAEPGAVEASVRIGITVQRGPAMQGRDADIPVFLAVTLGDDVRDKQVFPVRASFPPNVDRLTMSSPPIELSLPVSRTVTGASYGIVVGFQLTPEEIAANRQDRARR
jgi:hypothetical protein